MINYWEDLISFIDTKTLASPSWKSDKESLLEIFSYAVDHKIDPSFARKASLSKLRVIIKNAKKCVRVNDPVGLARLFELAGTLSIVDLRLKLGISEPEDVFVKKGVEKNMEIYILTLRKDQFERIKKSTKPYFSFNIETKS